MLERDVVPAFYERGGDRIPRKWVERMKACVDSLCHFINTHRMVRDYVEGSYVKAHARFRELAQEDARRTRELNAALGRIWQCWQDVWVAQVDGGIGHAVSVGSPIRISAQVHLGRLSPGDVAVELYVGSVNMSGELVEGRPVPMQSEGNPTDGTYRYSVETSIARSGQHGFTVRVRPFHPDMPTAFVPQLFTWAGDAKAPALAGV